MGRADDQGLVSHAFHGRIRESAHRNRAATPAADAAKGPVRRRRRAAVTHAQHRRVRGNGGAVGEIVRVHPEHRNEREDLLENPRSVGGGMEGRAAPREDETAGRPEERTHIGRGGSLQCLRDEPRLPEDHVVHVERMTAPRIGKSDHVRASRWRP